MTFETAKAAASNPSDFELEMKMFSRLSHSPAGDDVARDDAAAAPTTSVSADGAPSEDLDFLTSS